MLKNLVTESLAVSIHHKFLKVDNVSTYMFYNSFSKFAAQLWYLIGMYSQQGDHNSGDGGFMSG